MKVGKEFAVEAKKLGICDEWYNRLLNYTNFKQLAKMYFKGSDWAMENDFPNVDLLRKYITEFSEFGIFTDYSGTLEGTRKMAFFGKSEVEIIASGYDVQEIYIRHNSRAKITAKENAYVVVNVLDDAEVEIINEGVNKVSVYRYSDNAKIVEK